MKSRNKLYRNNHQGSDAMMDEDYTKNHEEVESDENEFDEIFENSPEENEISSEDEILPIYSETDSDKTDDEHVNDGRDFHDEDGGISDSDVENIEDELPSSKAWGRNAKHFYNTNRIDSKTKFNDDEEDLAKLEEIEARNIQQRLLGELEEFDLSLDLMTSTAGITQRNEEYEGIVGKNVELDLTTFNEMEKTKLLSENCPQLATFICDFKRLLSYTNDEHLSPQIELKNKEVGKSSTLKLVEIFRQLIMNYCTNVAFFFLLKSEKLDTALHPVMKWISTFEEMVKESESIHHETVKLQKPTIKNESPKKFENSLKRKRNGKVSDIKLKSVKLVDEEKLRDSVANNADHSKLAHLYNELSESENEEASGKRAINYQIAKNKGLTPHRKKELRNPRVKHRMKYRKAKIRRKGQVREARNEIQKYAGEISGIKSTVVKSVKFKT